MSQLYLAVPWGYLNNILSYMTSCVKPIERLSVAFWRTFVEKMAGQRTLMIGIVGSILMIGVLVRAEDGVG